MTKGGKLCLRRWKPKALLRRVICGGSSDYKVCGVVGMGVDHSGNVFSPLLQRESFGGERQSKYALRVQISSSEPGAIFKVISRGLIQSGDSSLQHHDRPWSSLMAPVAWGQKEGVFVMSQIPTSYTLCSVL